MLRSSLHLLYEAGLEAGASTVEVSLPPSWRVAACQPGRQVLSARSSGAIAPDLTLRDSGSEPRSLQPRGCGDPGLGVYLPLSVLLENRTNLNRTLAQELINSRLGMFAQGSGNLSIFSDQPDYDRYAPTQQNLLCGGRSPLEMIQTLEKHENLTKAENFTVPEFRYVVKGEEHYVLVLDQTSMMDLNQRWINVKRGFYRFINGLKEGSMLSIITFGKEANLVLPPTVVTQTNREGLHGRIPRRTEEVEKVCLSCGIQLAHEILQGSSGTIVLVTGASAEQPVPRDGVNAKQFTVLYPSQPGTPEISDGTVYTLVEKDGESALLRLNEVLVDVMNRVEEETLAKVHESDHLSYEFSGTFIVEENLRTDITVTLTVEDEQKVEYFEVIDPSGQKNIFSKFEDGMVVLRFPGSSEPGIWTFHAKLYPEAGLPSSRMVVDVVGRGKGREISVVGVENTVVQDISAPVQILVRVERGEIPVYGAEIRAVVYGPDSETELILRDEGYPDTRTGDGIYSGYLARFSSVSGYYTLRILSSDNNGRAFTLSTGAPIPTGSFRRFVTSPSFYVKVGVEPGKDVVPPSRVTDLSLAPANTTSLEPVTNSSSVLHEPTNSTSLDLELVWTAPGADYDSGRVERYEIRCHTNPLALSEANFSSNGILVNLEPEIQPRGSGNLERSVVKVPWSNELFYYALTSYDRAGNRGPVSNLVQVFVVEETTPAGLELVGDGELELKLGQPSWFLDRNQIYIIAGAVGGVILVVVVLVIVLILRAKRVSRSKTQWVADTYEAGFDPSIKVEKVETESGIYSWLESLPRSEKKGCEEGSNSSRPTTSTDDSISDNGDHQYPEQRAVPQDEVSHDEYAQQVLTRSLYYYSIRDARRHGIEGRRDGMEGRREGSMCLDASRQGLRVNPAPVQVSETSRSTPDSDYTLQNQIRKKRHESVV